MVNFKTNGRRLNVLKLHLQDYQAYTPWITFAPENLFTI
jgi:hypothetical protein